MAGPAIPSAGSRKAAKGGFRLPLEFLGRIKGLLPFLKKKKESQPGEKDENPQKRVREKRNWGETFKGFVHSLFENKLAVGLILAFLLLFLAFAVVALLLFAPPKVEKTKASQTPSGTALLRRVILPSYQVGGRGDAPRVELERERGGRYTDEDVEKFRTDPASVDLRGLRERNQAEIEALYESLP